MEVPRNNHKEVLIIRLTAMGDVAMTLPIIENLKKENPKVGITILTAKMVMPLFSHIHGITVIGWDLKHEGSVKYIFKKFRELRRLKKFNMVVDLHDVLRTKLLRTLFALSGVKVVTIDKGRREKRDLVKKHTNIQLKTTVQRYIDTLERANLKVNIVTPTLKKHTTPLPKSLIQAIGEKEGTWIGIAPFAKHKGKAYPLEMMERVMDILATNEDYFFFIFSGGGQEREQAKALAGRYRNAVEVFGKMLLDGELKLIANIDCMVTMDSGAMHFASAVGTPVVSIWGATHPHAGFLGFGQDEKNVIQCEMDCRPCSIFGNKPCYKGGDNAYECMTSISPEVVAEKVIEVINRSKK